MAPTLTAPDPASWSTNEFSKTTMKPIFDTLKHVLGLKTGKQVEFDSAMTLILKAGGDSQLYLDGENRGDAEVLGRLVHAWSDAAVKINRIDGSLRDGCLELAQLFACSTAGDDNSAALRERVSALRERAHRFLEDGAGLF